MKRLPIGVDDYKEIVDDNLYFVDKTMFIKDIIDDGSKAILIARPRRFGKTLNISLLNYYFNKTEQDNSYLFEGRHIWRQGERYRREQGKYPVINLTFKGAKYYDWETNYRSIRSTISAEIIRHKYILESNVLSGNDKYAFMRLYEGGASKDEYGKSLEILSRAVSKYHNEKVIILLDEYDTLLNEAYIHGFWREAIEFMRTFVNEGFKNNIYLQKGILTGIFRVAKESVFSDLNNLNVSTVLSDNYNEYFGFTQQDVEEMMRYYGIEGEMEAVAEWYNGYVFGERRKVTIYNPWSIVMYVNTHSLRPYWINTSGNAIIKQLATGGGKGIQLKMQDIIEGKLVEDVKVDENVIYSEIMKSDRNIWSFMLMSGYLTPAQTKVKEDGIYYTLKAPNKEVHYFYRNLMESWFDETIYGGNVREMLGALLKGDINIFYKIFATTVMKTVSFNDVGDDTSESFYHAFVLGLLVYLDTEYEIKSNRESGYGRYDVMVIPKDITKRGVVIEFKKADRFENESLDNALAAALDQITEKRYEVELTQRGIKEVVKLAIVFKGKDVKMAWRDVGVTGTV